MRKMLVLFVCILLCSVGSASAVTLSLNPSPVTVDVGDTFSITLDALMSENGPGLNNSNGAPGAISAWDVDVMFNPSQMAFAGYSLGTGLVLSVDLSWGEYSPGIVDLAEFSLEDSLDLVANQPDAFLLAALTFECLRPGVSLIELMVDYVGDENGNPVLASAGAPVSVTQNPVPEPSTLLLIVTGLLGVGVLRRKIK